MNITRIYAQEWIYTINIHKNINLPGSSKLCPNPAPKPAPGVCICICMYVYVCMCIDSKTVSAHACTKTISWIRKMPLKNNVCMRNIYIYIYIYIHTHRNTYAHVHG